MVDAISSFNAKNTAADLAINWNKLTVKEIKEYEAEGQEVPEYIKKWAEYMERLDSVPDDVTYMTYVNPSGIAETDETAGLAAGLNPSASTQAGMYGKLCKDSVSTIKAVTEQLDEIMKRAEQQVNEAASGKEGICDRIQTLQQRANTIKNDKKNPLGAMELVQINNQIQTTGDTGMSSMELHLAALENIGSQVSDAYDLISGAKGLASTARSYAKGVGTFSLLTYTYTKELEELRKEKKKDLKSANEQQDRNIQTVGGYKSDIGLSISQFTTDAPVTVEEQESQNQETSTAKIDDKNAETKQKKTQANQKTQEEKKKTLADQKILTDPNEILKRKQKRGEA